MDFFVRYIPLSRIKISLSTEDKPGPGCSITSFSTCDELEKTASSTIIECKLGSVEAAAKACFTNSFSSLPL